MNKNKAVRLCGGLALAVGVSLVPMGAMAHNHATAPAAGCARCAGAAGGAGQQDQMAGAAAAGHHGAMAAHHSAMRAPQAAPPAHHAPMPPHSAAASHAKPYVHKMAPKRHTGSVEGGSGASDNDGGSITGAHAPAHVHGDNQGGDIH